MSEGVAVSVVIVSFDTREMTLECLGKLYDGLAGISAEVFVVDNGSTDGSAEAIQSAFADVQVIANQCNRGFGAANNQAIRLARGEFILLLNSDAFVMPDTVGVLLSYIKAHPRSAVAGPKLLNRDGTLQRSCYKPASPWRATCDQLLLSALVPNSGLFGDYRRWAHDRDRQVEMVIGACMLVRKSAIDQVGMFDEDFFLYSEEADWCQRFRAVGWTVDFAPAAQAVHLNGASGGGSGTEQSDRVYTEFHRGQERLVRKHYGGPGLAWYRLMVICGATLRIVLFGLLGAIASGRRTEMFANVAGWRRLLLWTLGRRGPGLSELKSESAANLVVTCV
jgi:GT2 family glycosyltransferase